MHRLTGQDAFFLYRETPTAVMHTMKIFIMDPATQQVSMEQIRQGLKSYLHLVPVLRQRVVPVPLSLHHPVMINDPDFDLNAHICRGALPAPGGIAQLDEMVAYLASQPLDRSRPLWELWVLEGLVNGQLAVVYKMHHCLADGAASMGYLSRVWAPTVEPSHQGWIPETVPSPLRLVRDAIIDHARYGIRRLPGLASTVVKNGRSLYRHYQQRGPENKAINPLTTVFPKTRFNRALAVRRSVASVQLSLEQVRQVKILLNGTVNDVLMAVTTSALREYLNYHNELPEMPLLAAIPVSADEPEQQRISGNNVASLLTLAHVQISDPVKRYQAVRQQTLAGKQELAAFGKTTFGQLLEYMPPLIYKTMKKREYRTRAADHREQKGVVNLTVSNVPGPRELLSSSAGVVKSLYSVGVLSEGVGLNITAWSYVDQLNITLLACDKAMPDLDRLARGFHHGLDELLKAVTAANDAPTTEPKVATVQG